MQTSSLILLIPLLVRVLLAHYRPRRHHHNHGHCEIHRLGFRQIVSGADLKFEFEGKG